jgi:FkbM family methyltransferase
MRILFDIGANHGLYTDANQEKYDLCVLVEANPMLCDELREKFKANTKIHVIHAIASNKNTETFYISNADQISTADTNWITKSRFTGNYMWVPVNGIPTISLDTLIKQYPEVTRIKIDVEGYEYNVLQSLHTKVPSLCFEFAEEKMEELLLSMDYVKQLGYTKFHIQYQDKFTYEVAETMWISYEELKDHIYHSFIPSQKEKWGMIWAS